MVIVRITWPTYSSSLRFLSIKKQRGSSPINSTHGTQIVFFLIEKKKKKKKQLKRRFSSRGCESIKENVRLETSACALDSCYLHPPKATERIDSEWNWQSCHNSGCQVSKWSIREDWKPFRTLEKWANEM